LVFIQQVNDRSAADKAFASMDKKMNQPQVFKVEKSTLNGKEVINWTTPMGVTPVTHGWLDNDRKFLSLGAPVANSFVPQPQQKLADSPLFQQSTRSSLSPHNGQFFIDVDRSINAGNLPLPLPAEFVAGFKGIRSLGVTSAILDESSNRFDLFVALKKVPGVAKFVPKVKPQKSLKSSPTPTKSPSPKPQ
jgi:hypothetical protein